MAKKTSKKTTAASSKVPTKAEKPKKGQTTPLKDFFEESGIRFDMSVSKILKEIEQKLGKDRYKQWYDVSIARQMGKTPSANEYCVFQNADEVNTLFSLQAPVSLAVCTWLADQVTCHGKGEVTVGDLGCGAGVLAGWLAKQHPSHRVHGFDALPNLVLAAAESQKRKNLAFHTWDYEAGPSPIGKKCEVLVSCFGIDFPPCSGAIHPKSVETLRAGEFYESQKAYFQTFFRNWRSGAVEGGTLYCALRIPFDSMFLAFVDGGIEEGWDFDIDRSTSLFVGAESFPAMVFHARSPRLLAEDEVLAKWCYSQLKEKLNQRLYGTVALTLYRTLQNKVLVKQETIEADSVRSYEAVVGHAGTTAFQFTHGTTGYAFLRFFPLTDLGTLDVSSPEELWFDSPFDL